MFPRRSLAVFPFLWALALVSAPRALAAGKCVQIFYDRAPQANPRYDFGRQHAMMLQNLLGHFPDVQQHVIPIELYQAGDLGKCAASIYLGTHFADNLPKDFLADFVATDKRVAWAGYKTWLLPPEDLARIWGVRYRGLSQLDGAHRDADGKPTFFKFHEYKGETFTKYGEWDRVDRTRFNAAFEITMLDMVAPEAEANVLAWARHSATGEKLPYVLRHDNRWFIADSPFSFATEEDRYLIMADLLFDILDEPPRRPAGKRPAVLRFEDIHANVSQWQLYTMVNLTTRLRVPLHMTIIPIFTDPLGATTVDPLERFMPMTSNPSFLEFLAYAKAKGTRFIYHGVTHQLGTRKNPFTGMTGDDFEFWDRVNNKPIPMDSPSYVVNRLEDGLKILDKAGVRPFAWLSPHYQSSPLDYVVFSQLYRWNMGRLIYFPAKVSQARRLPPELGMDVAGVAAAGKRLPYFADLKVDYPAELQPTGQFFPYEIYGDVYGSRILPENVGNVQPYMNEQVYKTEKVEDMLRHMRLNRVIRDSWASFFIHPFSLGDSSEEGIGLFPGDTSQVERIIAGAREAGFEFVDLETFAAANRAPMRPEPIERFVPGDR